MEPGDHARLDINRKGQPRAPNWLAVFAVNDNHIDRGVIDLHHLERTCGASDDTLTGLNLSRAFLAPSRRRIMTRASTAFARRFTVR
jgi:hypothetical protein